MLELSFREALQLGHSYIGTEHLLLGLVREGEGVAATVLVSLGADLGRVRQQVIQLMTGGQAPLGGARVDRYVEAMDPGLATGGPRCPRWRERRRPGSFSRTERVRRPRGCRSDLACRRLLPAVWHHAAHVLNRFGNPPRLRAGKCLAKERPEFDIARDHGRHVECPAQ